MAATAGAVGLASLLATFVEHAAGDKIADSPAGFRGSATVACIRAHRLGDSAELCVARPAFDSCAESAADSRSQRRWEARAAAMRGPERSTCPKAQLSELPPG